MLQAIIGNVADVADRLVALNNQDGDRVSAILAFFHSYTVFMQVRIYCTIASVYAPTAPQVATAALGSSFIQLVDAVALSLLLLPGESITFDLGNISELYAGNNELKS